MSMNPVSPPAELPREPMRWPKKLNLLLAIVVGLFIFWVWLKHEQAESSVEAYKRELLAKGERLDLKELRPQMPKPEDNATPEFLAAARKLKTYDTSIHVDGKPLRFPFSATDEMARPTSSTRARVAWQQPQMSTVELGTEKSTNAWPKWIAWTEVHRSALRDGVKALDRPGWGVDINWDPRIERDEYPTGLEILFRALVTAVVVDLRHGRPAEAHTNLLALTELLTRLDEPTTFLGGFRLLSMSRTASRATWEALQYPNWTDEQLTALQHRWERTDLLKALVRYLEQQRPLTIFFFDDHRRNTDKLGMFDRRRWIDSEVRPPEPAWNRLKKVPSEIAESIQMTWRLSIWPNWNSDHDEHHDLQTIHTWLELAREAHAHPNTFAAYRAIEGTSSKITKPPKAWLWSHVLNNEEQGTVALVAYHETIRRLTITAIALERHRLRHGSYPASLAALVPDVLREVPVDLQDAQPLRYRREANGEFLLWSVGKNGVDDGGNGNPVGAPAGTRPKSPFGALDIVWPRPASHEEVSALHAELAAERAKNPHR